MIPLKSNAEILKMRDSGRIVAEILQILQEKANVGVTTRELDIVAEAECLKVQEAFAVPPDAIRR